VGTQIGAMGCIRTLIFDSWFCSHNSPKYPIARLHTKQQTAVRKVTVTVSQIGDSSDVGISQG